MRRLALGMGLILGFLAFTAAGCDRCESTHAGPPPAGPLWVQASADNGADEPSTIMDGAMVELTDETLVLHFEDADGVDQTAHYVLFWDY